MTTPYRMVLRLALACAGLWLLSPSVAAAAGNPGGSPTESGGMTSTGEPQAPAELQAPSRTQVLWSD